MFLSYSEVFAQIILKALILSFLSSLAQTPALHWQTEYSHDYKGARGRPSTTER